MGFIDQYGSDEWKQRRAEILKIDGERCRRCGSDSKLEVHHIHYIPGRFIWQYDENELVTLCRNCHLEIHHYKNYVTESLFKLMSDWCFRSDTGADYGDAWMILKYLSEMDRGISKKYASLCISTAMVLEDF